MASAAFYVWADDGRPYRLCRPAAKLQAHLRAHGLTVYDYPNKAHLEASTPEDHTPFSATGWPRISAYGVGHAVDIMSRDDSAAALKENADIARQLIADRNAGVPAVMWIKYLNWTDEHGVCRQERWMPNHETRTSTDVGHVHVSGRSDCDDDTRADNYDPLKGSNDMEQSEPLVAPWGPSNKIENAFAVVMETRKGVFGASDASTGYGAPHPDSMAGRVRALVIKVDALDAKVDAIQAGQVSQEALDAAVLAALQNPAILALLVDAAKQGADKAEDS
jgi:hypothetical protein